MLKLWTLSPLVALALGACELSTKNLGEPHAESATDATTAPSTGGQTSLPSTGPGTGDSGSSTTDPVTSEPDLQTTNAVSTASESTSGPSSTSGETGVCEDPLQAPGVGKACAVDQDCVVVFHQTDCCGSLEAYGIDADAQGAYDEAEAPCVMPATCDCAPMPTPAEDGDATGDNQEIVAVCVANQCQSQIPDAGPLQWHTTCGDPVCSGYTKPDGVEPCTPAQLEGSLCDVEGATCDPISDCNALLVCASKDPKQQEGGCPISRAKFKTDIEYLEPADLARHADELASLRLATYRYRDAPADAPARLGIILEDNEQGVWVDARHDRVDLYGYASLAVAALQVQQRQIASLTAEVERLSMQLETTPMCGP